MVKVAAPNVIVETFARPLPRLTERNSAFWKGGLNGELLILRCQACGTYIHPPVPTCPSCRATNLAAEAVSGAGTIYSFTVNWYPWVRDITPPYVVAIIELVEQPGLFVTSNLVECHTDDAVIGMQVEVVFAQHDDVYIPLFRPADGQ